MIVISKVNQFVFFSDFLCCCEKAHDNKESSCENSKPCRESRIMTC